MPVLCRYDFGQYLNICFQTSVKTRETVEFSTLDPAEHGLNMEEEQDIQYGGYRKFTENTMSLYLAYYYYKNWLVPISIIFLSQLVNAALYV